MREIYVESIALKPKLQVSAAAITWGNGPVTTDDWRWTSAYADVLQDWRAWLEEGIIDMAFPMTYDQESSAQQRQWFDAWIEWIKNHSYGRHVVIGVGAFMNDIDDTLAQTQRALEAARSGQRASGVSFYSYAQADARGLSLLRFIDALTVGGAGRNVPLFPDWRPAPEMPWKVQPVQGMLGGRVQTATAYPIEQLTVNLAGAGTRTLAVGADGFFGATNLAPGQYTLSLRHGTQELALTTVTIAAGAVTPAEFK